MSKRLLHSTKRLVKRHKDIAYENDNLFNQFDAELQKYNEDDEYDSSNSDSEISDYDDSVDDDNGTENEEKDTDVPVSFSKEEEEMGREIDTNVFHFPRGCAGEQHLLKYRMRPPLADMNYTEQKDFEFQLNCIEYEVEESGPLIRIYGITREGYSVTANVYKFLPHFTIRWTGEMQPIEFITKLESKLREGKDWRMKDFDCLIKKYTISDGIGIAGYETVKKFMTLTMAYPALVGRARRIIESDDWDYSDIVSDTYESDIDFTLRYLCDNNFTGEETLTVPAYRFKIRKRRNFSCNVDIEIDIPDYRNLTSATNQIDVSFKKILSFDIEVHCDRGCFPQAEKDKVIMIAACLRILGKPERKKICLCLGPSLSIEDRHPGAEVLCYESEVDMLRAFRWLFILSDPDIITGYNIINFDLAYILDRAETLKLEDRRAKEVAYLGRLIKRRSVVKDDTKNDRAHGFRQSKKINIEGRTQFDMLLILPKEVKLRSYTLNSVSAHFLGDQKEEMSYDLIPKFYREDPTRLVIYCLKDAILPDDLIQKLRTILKYIQKARVTGIAIEQLLNRGLGYQGKSRVYRIFMRQTPRAFVYVRTEKQRSIDSQGESYVGAHVEPPIKGYHKDPIVTLDFSSLYPSIIIAYNMCVTTRITVAYARSRGWIRASLHGDGSDGDYFQIPNFEFDREKKAFETIYSDSDTCFVTKKHKKGITPQILEEFLTKRKSVKREKANHEETKERLREYAADIIYSDSELQQNIERYKEELKEKEELLKQDRPDKLKLKRESERLKWKIEKLTADAVFTDEEKQEAAKEALKRAELEAFLEMIADFFQLEIKLCANSIYGLFGAKVSFLYYMAIAAAVTSIGRYMIVLTRFDTEKKFCISNGYSMDAQVVYGDSVTSDTPVLVKHHGRVFLRCIKDLPTDPYGWRKRDDGKEYATPATGLLVWSDSGFTTIKQLIRHDVSKQLHLVTTESGAVVVTEDHSLIQKNGSVIKPKELKKSIELLTTECPVLPIHDNSDNGNLFWLWGLFFGCGDCEYSKERMFWSLKCSEDDSKRAEFILSSYYPNLTFLFEKSGLCLQILEAKPKESGFLCGIWGGEETKLQEIVSWIRDWRNMFFYDGLKKVPDIIFNAAEKHRKAFFNGCKIDKNTSIVGQLGAAGLYVLMKSLNYEVQVTVGLQLKRMSYSLKICKHRRTSHVQDTIIVDSVYGTHNSVKSWYGEDSCVYDLETENHHFAAGVGNLVVHNTDSIFVKMPGLTLEEARVVGMEMSVYCSKRWPAPHKLEAEKILCPTLLLKKKKYADLKYEMDPETGGLKKPKVDEGGLETVRRDNCRLSTRIMKDVLNLLLTSLDGHGEERSKAYVKQEVAKLLRGDVNMFDLIVSKQLRRETYATPTVHSQLAKRLGLRAGSRVPYVIVKKHVKAKLHECGEDPETAFRNGIPIDYRYYLMKQIVEPLIRLYAPILAPKLDIDNKLQQACIRRIVHRELFVGDHMRVQKVTLNKNPVNRGIFSVAPQCASCKRILKNGEQQYCVSCKETHGQTMLNQLQDQLQQLSEASLKEWETCQKCIKVNVATHIVCDQNDCFNYWQRRKTASDIETISCKLNSLIW